MEKEAYVGIPECIASGAEGGGGMSPGKEDEVGRGGGREEDMTDGVGAAGAGGGGPEGTGRSILGARVSSFAREEGEGGRKGCVLLL